MSLSVLPCCVTNVEIYISMNISISASASSDKQSFTSNYTNSSSGLISIPYPNIYSSDLTGCTVCGYQGFDGNTIDNGFFIGGIEYNNLLKPLLGIDCPDFAIPGSCGSECGKTICNSGKTYRISSSNIPNEESNFEATTCSYYYVSEGGGTEYADVGYEDYCTNVQGNVCNNNNCTSDATLLVYHPSLENTIKHYLSLNFNTLSSELPISISTASGGYPISGGLYVNGGSTPTPLYITHTPLVPYGMTNPLITISGSLNIGVMYDTDQARNPETGLCPSV